MRSKTFAGLSSTVSISLDRELAEERIPRPWSLIRLIRSPRQSSRAQRLSCGETRVSTTPGVSLQSSSRSRQRSMSRPGNREILSPGGRFLCCGTRRPTKLTRRLLIVGDRVDSWIHKPGACPNFTLDEYHDVDDALREHPEVLARLAARGITDPSLVLFDVDLRRSGDA